MVTWISPQSQAFTACCQVLQVERPARWIGVFGVLSSVDCTAQDAELRFVAEFLTALDSFGAVMHNSSASLSDLQGGYFEMLKMNDDHRVASGCSQISVGGIDALSRWAETRARHHPWGSRSSPGRAPGTSAALRSSQAHRRALGMADIKTVR